MIDDLAGWVEHGASVPIVWGSSKLCPTVPLLNFRPFSRRLPSLAPQALKIWSIEHRAPSVNMAGCMLSMAVSSKVTGCKHLNNVAWLLVSGRDKSRCHCDWFTRDPCVMAFGLANSSLNTATAQLNQSTTATRPILSVSLLCANTTTVLLARILCSHTDGITW